MCPLFVCSIFNVRYITGRDCRVTPSNLFSALCDYFSKFVLSPNGPSFKFLLFCNKLDFHKPQRVLPFRIFKPSSFLSLRYSADLRPSRLVLNLMHKVRLFSVVWTPFVVRWFEKNVLEKSSL